MLYDLHRLAWDTELLSGFGVPAALLPEVCDTGADFGVTLPELFGDAIPIAAIAGDQQAALIGQACFRPGMVKSTYGTGAFALVHTGAKPAASTHQLLTTIAYRLQGETAYALEGSIFIAGAAVQWLRDRLGVIAGAPDTQALAERADPRQRVYFVPAFAGLGAPYWQPAARGAISGLTAECGVPELARATLEAVGYQTRDLISAMEADSGLKIETLRVDGGMAASDWTMQFLADILPARVERPPSIETTAWGAAYAAGLQRSICPPPAEMTARWRAERMFAPAMPDDEREERYAGWTKAVAQLLASASRSRPDREKNDG
jgi:glycerol kinase